MKDIFVSPGESVLISCPLCGSKRSLFFYEDLGVTFRQCATCRLVYVNPRAPEDYYLAGYRSVDDHAADFDAPGNASITRIKGFEKGIELLKKIKAGGSLLDVGCGDGRFLQMILSCDAYDLHGVELSRVAAESVSGFLGIEVLPCTLADAKYPDRFFDVVVMWDVLEHVYDPSRELAEVKRVLREDGVLLARVPNLAYFRVKQAVAGRYLKSRGRTVYHGGHHLTYLNAATAHRLMEKAGFEVLSLRPSRTEYGLADPRLLMQSAYQAFALAAHTVSGGRLTLSIDLLILAQPA